jgi:hypothetical protein
MSEDKSHNMAEIEELLAARQQLTGWLERLNVAGARAPESVKAKVRADYRGRLAQVVNHLRSHAELIGSTLDGVRAQAREFRQLRTEEMEIRAEAELRHAVGEYSDHEWQLVELDSSGKIAGFDQELERLAGEIQRLEEVQGLIAPAPAPEPAPEPTLIVTHDAELPPMLDQDPLSMPDQPALSLVKDEEVPAPPPQPRPEAPRFVPRGGMPKPRESGPARAIPFPQHPQTPGAPAAAPGDELAFLRSVSLDAQPPAARTTSAPANNALGALDREERQNQVVSKTLKCGECGSLNRPTEWYCERCGAELAAL